MTRGELGDTLALVNACLNAASAVLIVAGKLAIVSKDRERHKRFMLSAFATSSIFLASYLTRVALTGTHADPHHGVVHAVYLAILGTHMVLAIVSLPLILVALRHAWTGAFDKHLRVVRWAMPIWLYVSVTGVLVYAILYRVPVG